MLFCPRDELLFNYHLRRDFRYTVCHKTEVIKNNLNPEWKEMTVPVSVLCNGDYERTIKVDVYDWDRDGG